MFFWVCVSVFLWIFLKIFNEFWQFVWPLVLWRCLLSLCFFFSLMVVDLKSLLAVGGGISSVCALVVVVCGGSVGDNCDGVIPATIHAVVEGVVGCIYWTSFISIFFFAFLYSFLYFLMMCREWVEVGGGQIITVLFVVVIVAVVEMITIVVVFLIVLKVKFGSVFSFW